MEYAANGYLNAISSYFYDGNMFFLCRIDGVLGHEFHGFTTAHQFSSTGMDDFNDISAQIAFVYFQ